MRILQTIFSKVLIMVISAIIISNILKYIKKILNMRLSVQFSYQLFDLSNITYTIPQIT